MDLAKAREIASRKQEQGRAEELSSLVELGNQRGYSNPEGWARHIWTSRVAKKEKQRLESMGMALV